MKKAKANEGYLYDWENDHSLDRQNKDINFYNEIFKTISKSTSKILDLGCGTGRITVPLSRLTGNVIHGLDLSEERIIVAKEKSLNLPNVDYFIGDMSDYRFDIKYDLIIVSYNSFLLLEDNQRRMKCLHNVRRHLSDTGIAVIDISQNFSRHEERIKSLELENYCKYLDVYVRYYVTVIQDHIRRITTFKKYYYLFDDKRYVNQSSKYSTLYTIEKWNTLEIKEMEYLIAQSGLRLKNIYYNYSFLTSPLQPNPNNGHKNIFILAKY